ncbi:MAG: hypothetical protein OXL41_04740 [Nitrospinae bacterium]|nr:hypothetical protein [Nitrospinota bacterium]
MPTRKDKLVELASDLFVDATDWDLQITSDTQKYSGWFLAIATGGLALIAARFDALVKSSWTSEYAFLVLIAATIILVGACVAGISYHYITKEIIKKKRQQKTLILKQKCRLFFTKKKTTASGVLAQEIWGMKYLEQQDKHSWDDCKNEEKHYDRCSERMLLWQQILAGAGYLLLLVYAIGPGT